MLSLCRKPKHLHVPRFDSFKLPVSSVDINTIEFLGILGFFDVDIFTIEDYPEPTFVITGEEKNLDRFAEYWAKRGLYACTV